MRIPTCPQCGEVTCRIRSATSPAALTHYYRCISGHHFTTVEVVSTKARVDRKQVGRLIHEGVELLGQIRRVLRLDEPEGEVGKAE